MAESSSTWFVYDHTVDGLFFKALRERITPPVEAKLKALGIDLQGKPRSVPHAQWVEALQVAAALFEGTEDERFRQLGRSVLLRYEDTVMGKAVVAVMRLMGPRRILGRINTSLRSGNNYIHATLSPVGPTTWEGTINECNGSPQYIVGVIEQGLHIAGAKEVSITVSDFDGHAAKFRIAWG